MFTFAAPPLEVVGRRLGGRGGGVTGE